MPFSIFNFFETISGGCGNSAPGPSEAEKLICLGKKNLRLPPEESLLEPIQKKTLFQYTLGRVMFLKDCVYRRLRRTCIYGNQGLINNLRAESG